MRHIEVDNNLSIRCTDSLEVLQVMEWDDLTLLAVYSKTDEFPEVFEQMENLTVPFEISSMKYNEHKAYVINSDLYFTDCTERDKLFLKFQYLKKKYFIDISEEDNKVKLTFKDAELNFILDDVSIYLLKGKGDYFKYLDYLYYLIQFKYYKGGV